MSQNAVFGSLLDYWGFMNAAALLAIAILVCAALIVTGSIFALLRRRRRLFRVLAYACLIPGLGIPLALAAWIFLGLALEGPLVEKSWDLSAGPGMEAFDSDACFTQHDRRRCVYKGNLSLSIDLPASRRLRERAAMVWVSGEAGRLESIMIYSATYGPAELAERVQQMVASWRLDGDKFGQWRRDLDTPGRRMLHLVSLDETVIPRFWLVAKPVNDQTEAEWFYQTELVWD